MALKDGPWPLALGRAASIAPRLWFACAWSVPLLGSAGITHADTCSRTFDDAAIRRTVDAAIVEQSLNVDRPYRIDVHWSDCKYFVSLWRTDPPPSPDSQVELTLDEAGRLIERPNP